MDQKEVFNIPKKYFKPFNGRIGRKNYFLGLAFFIISFYILFILLGVVLSNIGLVDYVVIIMNFCLIIDAFLVFSLHIRRLHDRGHSGLWILAAPIDIMLNFFVRGQEVTNKYVEVPSESISFLDDIFSRF